MLRATILLLAVGCCLSEDINLKNHWGKFKSTFKKRFSSKQQENLKQVHWENKVKDILKHNVEADLGIHSYKKAVNEFTDYTTEEFHRMLTGVVLPENVTERYAPLGKSARALPDNHDWRDFNVVTPAKSQGSCGSCWAFAVAATIESALAIKTGQKPVDLSVQQFLDCSSSYGTHGCGGGYPNFAFEYAKYNGIATANCYPYEKKATTCRLESDCKTSKIVEYYNVPKTEDDLKQYVYEHGPIATSIYANDNLSAYSSGIYTDDNCKKTINHAVVVVGYGTENGQDYWIVKNSWGSYWGEKGFFRMARNYDARSLCSISKFTSYPVV